MSLKQGTRPAKRGAFFVAERNENHCAVAGDKVTRKMPLLPSVVVRLRADAGPLVTVTRSDFVTWFLLLSRYVYFCKIK